MANKQILHFEFFFSKFVPGLHQEMVDQGAHDLSYLQVRLDSSIRFSYGLFVLCNQRC
jgi:hypothetical protein